MCNVHGKQNLQKCVRQVRAGSGSFGLLKHAQLVFQHVRAGTKIMRQRSKPAKQTLPQLRPELAGKSERRSNLFMRFLSPTFWINFFSLTHHKKISGKRCNDGSTFKSQCTSTNPICLSEWSKCCKRIEPFFPRNISYNMSFRHVNSIEVRQTINGISFIFSQARHFSVVEVSCH